MRSALALVVVLVLFATPAFAADGQVPQGTLASLGLGDMQTVSDAEGTQVRGKFSWFGMVKGTSLIFGQLLDPNTKEFVVGSSVNEVDANAESTQADVDLGLFKSHGVELHLNLNTPDFDGMIMGTAGGFGGVANWVFFGPSGP